MAYYQRIRDLREDSDKTQAELAEVLGTTAQYYGKYEKGERELPFSRAIQLAEFYGVSLDYLAGHTNNKQGGVENGLSSEALHIAEIFDSLTERSKGKLELFAEQLSENKIK